eukprot:SAG31_NODE_6154_length_2146_cov_1.617000_3_plen_302_part_00
MSAGYATSYTWLDVEHWNNDDGLLGLQIGLMVMTSMLLLFIPMVILCVPAAAGCCHEQVSPSFRDCSYSRGCLGAGICGWTAYISSLILSFGMVTLSTHIADRHFVILGWIFNPAAFSLELIARWLEAGGKMAPKRNHCCLFILLVGIWLVAGSMASLVFLLGNDCLPSTGARRSLCATSLQTSSGALLGDHETVETHSHNGNSESDSNRGLIRPGEDGISSDDVFSGQRSHGTPTTSCSGTLINVTMWRCAAAGTLPRPRTCALRTMGPGQPPDWHVGAAVRDWLDGTGKGLLSCFCAHY